MACPLHTYILPVLHHKLATPEAHSNDLPTGKAWAFPLCNTFAWSPFSSKKPPPPTHIDHGATLNCISHLETPCNGLDGSAIQLGFGSVHAFLLSWVLFGSSFIDQHEAARAADFGLESNSQAEQQMEPTKGNCATCLGVVDETLGACGAIPNCVSTFDDRPDFFIAPWEFPGNLSTAFKQLQGVLGKEGGNIVEEGKRYIHAVFTVKDGTIDDVEFLFSIPSEDATVNIRSACRKFSQNDYGRNQKRLTRIRQILMWEEVPVLRNRIRKLFFLESPWDTFGPEPPPVYDYTDKLEFVPD